MSRLEMEAETILAPILTAASSGTLRSAVLERPQGFRGYTSAR
jgi:hypothetical protein